MDTTFRWNRPILMWGIAALGAGTMASATGCTTRGAQTTSASTTGMGAMTSPTDAIRDWPAKPREVAQLMIAQYGPPHGITPGMLVWHQTGQWKRTIVYREEVPHQWPKPHTDILEQFIDYRVPPDRFDDLAMFDGSVIAERTKGELSARCDKEAMNYLAINLANDVATGRRTASDARAEYTRQAMAHMNGQSAPYTEALKFPVPSGGTADPDTASMPPTSVR